MGLVLTIHGVPDIAHPWVDTPQALFEEYMLYLYENDFTVLSMRDMAQFVDAKEALKKLTFIN